MRYIAMDRAVQMYKHTRIHIPKIERKGKSQKEIITMRLQIFEEYLERELHIKIGEKPNDDLS